MIKKDQERFCYKFNMKSELGKAFMNLWHLCNKAEVAADKFAAKAGAKHYYPAPSVFAGGVTCVAFEDDQPPRPNVWRSIGKDADGIEMWVLDVKQRIGTVVIEDETKIPQDTATRIYRKQAIKNSSGQMVWAYVELYRDDDVPFDKKHPNRKTPRYWSESFRTEKARLKLPVVTTETLLNLLQADMTNGKGHDGKPHVVRPITPTFFKYSQSIYLCCAYQCHAKGMTEISIGDYEEMEKEVRAMDRMIAKMKAES